MAGRTRSKSKKVASKAGRQRATAKPAKARKRATKSPARKTASRKAVAKSPARKKPATKKSATRKAATTTAAKKTIVKKTPKPKLLAGGNPQIAKGYGDDPVQAYIASMPDWKRAIGRTVDALVTRAVPNVRKAVKWNSPFYGVEEKSWFLSFHCFTNYVKVAFFRGASLNPVPPGESTQADVRYLDIRENDPIDEPQLLDWFRQASKLPGERM